MDSTKNVRSLPLSSLCRLINFHFKSKMPNMRPPGHILDPQTRQFSKYFIYFGIALLLRLKVTQNEQLGTVSVIQRINVINDQREKKNTLPICYYYTFKSLDILMNLS